jgi:phosphoenolpyruvate-protein phosphotransferase (PTS system enzyme I)
MRKSAGSTRARLRGTAVSPGTVIGTAYQAEPFSPCFYRIRISKEEVDCELRRFRGAVERSRLQLDGIRQKVENLVGKQHSYLVEVHLLILDDRRFISAIEARIANELWSAERAIRETAKWLLTLFRSLEDPYFQERGSELRDVEDRLLSNLTQEQPQTQLSVPEDLVLVAPEVSLSLLAQYRLERVKGLVLTNAGTTSHVAIIARSYQIPVVSGIGLISQKIQTGDAVIVDGYEGVVYRNPDARLINRYRERVRQEQARFDNPAEDQVPCVTSDGRSVCLYVNTETHSELIASLRQGAEGVGLCRSEFMFAKKPSLMSEDEQFEIYKSLCLAVGDKTLVLRTLDVGEGNLSSIRSASEGCSLGLRGIRLSFKYPEVFRAQIRAILRASHFANLKLVFPMISSADEMIQARSFVEEVRAGLEQEGVQIGKSLEIGVMLEVPAAVLTLDSILDHADFAAVGTNDLIQYTLAAGRANDQVAYLYNPLHPAVLLSLRRIAEVCRKRQKEALICGEIASHPLYVYVLLGLGFRHLSMLPSSIPLVKRAIREMSFVDARVKTAQMLRLSTLHAISCFVTENLSCWQQFDISPTPATHVV